jgi:hypothetical protein
MSLKAEVAVITRETAAARTQTVTTTFWRDGGGKKGPEVVDRIVQTVGEKGDGPGTRQQYADHLAAVGVELADVPEDVAA